MSLRTVAVLFATMAMPCFSAGITFNTQAGQTQNGFPVSASATLNLFNSNTLILTLDNLETNPTSDNQALSSFTFSVAGDLGITSITSIAQTVTIDGDAAGDYSLSSGPVSSGWTANYSNGSTTSISLCDGSGSGCNGAKNALVGAPNANNAYASANSSLTSSVNNPFLFETVTFTITGTNMPSTAALSGISNVNFGFTADAAKTHAAVFGLQILPEPPSGLMPLAGLALMAISALSRRLIRR